jgi:hypothetical protein
MAYTIVHPFSVTIPAGTLSTAPLVVPTVFAPNIVDHIEWVFPDGCNGLVGIQIGARNVPVVPGARAQFLIRSGSVGGLDVDEMHDSGDWSVIGYNLGVFPHTVQVTFTVHRKVKPAPIPGYLLSDAVLALHGGA